MSRPPGYLESPAQLVGGIAAVVIGEVLRSGTTLDEALDQWRQRGALNDDQLELIRWVAAGIQKAGAEWRVPRAGPASGTSSADLVALVSQSRPELLSTTEAAEMLGITPDAMKKLAQRRGLGQKVGRDWVFTALEIRTFANERSA